MDASPTLVEHAPRRVLVVEDDVTTLMLLQRSLKKMDFEVQAARTGAEAVYLAQSDDFGLVLMDMFLPDMTGIQILCKLREENHRNSKVPVMFITGDESMDTLREAFDQGVDDYLRKPFFVAELRRRCERHYESYSRRLELRVYAKEMQVLAEQRAQQLVRADRMNTLGMISAGIAHEINNPLTFIKGNIELLQHHYLPLVAAVAKGEVVANAEMLSEQLPELLDSMQKGVDRVGNIIAGIKSLAYQGESEAQLKILDFKDCWERALTLSQAAVRQRPVIAVNFPKTTELYSDGQLLEQVLMNLVVNASHAMEGLQEQKLSVTYQLEGERVKLLISDSGTGIPYDVAEHIWDPFFTTKPIGQGTGLGLPIIRQIMEPLLGTIELTNPGQAGACFCLDLPAIAPK